MAVVLAVAGLGIYQAVHNAKVVLVAAKASPTPSASPRPSNEFDVPPLEFKITLSSGLSGLTYTVDPPNNPHSGYTVDTARFTTTYLQDNGCKAGIIGGITMWTKDPRTVGVAGLGLVERVGNLYLVWDGSTYACTGSATVTANMLQMTKLLGQAFATAKPL